MGNLSYRHRGQSRPRPPFSKMMAGHLKPRNDIFLFLGKNGWQKANGLVKTERVLLLPDGNSPADYNWSIVKNFPVLLYDTSGAEPQTIRLLAYLLLKAGAEIVRLISADYVMTAIFGHDGGGGHAKQ